MDTNTTSLFRVKAQPTGLKLASSKNIAVSNKPAFYSAQKMQQSKPRLGAPQMIMKQNMLLNIPIRSSQNARIMTAYPEDSFTMKCDIQQAPSNRVPFPQMSMNSSSKKPNLFNQILNFDLSKIKDVKKSQVSMNASKKDSHDFVISTSGSKCNVNVNHMDEKINSKKLNVGQTVGSTAAALAILSASQLPANAADAVQGKQVFDNNCAKCHAGGRNVIATTKSLYKEDIEEYLDGGLNEKAIIYQVTNGKNVMPAWGEKLSEQEIKNVAAFVYDQASNAKWSIDD